MDAMSASSDKISVIIPAFNRRHEVLRAIASALAQTLPPDEILVIDDASTDGTVEVVVALQEPRIRIMRHARNRGAAAARNTGIEAAQGDWIAFLDSDDEWDKRKLALQLETLRRAPADTVAGVTGYILRDYRTGEQRSLLPTARDASLDALLWGCSLGVGSTLLARRKIFFEVGLLDPALPRLEDWEWLMRYLPAHRLGVLPDALTIVHKGGDPSVARVAASLSRIREKHRAAWYRRSWLAGRKFDSTLLVEEAAASYYARDLRQAAILSLRALVAYPLRRGFIAMLMRRTLHAVASR
jgi:glycosyltransferase involved in cell wall biosynthesis